MIVTREPRYRPPAGNRVGRMGRAAISSCREVGRATLLLSSAALDLRHAFKRRQRREIVMQMYTTGIKSLGVITVVAVFTGMILALQTGIELRRFNQEVNIGTAVMISMLREMGPFMTGLIMSACVGSAMAAQLGTMTVTEEVAALEIMSISPVRFLVMPRIAAMAIMTPVLAFYTCVLGVVGGGVVGMTQLGVPWGAYIDNATRYAEMKELYVGMLKAVLFGIIIATVACHEGFATTNGAVGVGRATRRTVVICFLMVLMVGYVVTRLFYY